MNIRLHPVLLVVMLLATLLAGFGLAQWLSSDKSHGEADAHDHAEADTHDDDHDDDGLLVLSARQIAAANIGIVPVGRGGGGETRLIGRVEPGVDARATVAATVSGRIEHVQVAPGERVEEGQTLVYVISGEATTLRATTEAAEAEAEAARLTYQRDLALVEQGVVARQELEASRARSLAADAAARAARMQLAQAGRPDARGRVAITSPVAGVVGAVQVAPGGFVANGGIVAEVLDPARTELVFTAPPAVVPQVAVGTRIAVSGPSGNFDATVVGVVADMRESNGAAVIRARSDNVTLPPAGSPVTGMTLAEADDSTQPIVPAEAVQTLEGRTVVFVASDEGFRAVPVRVGRRAGAQIEILDGLTGDERIAGSNAFLLKAELAKGEADHAH